jgi:hypothetical protein
MKIFFRFGLILLLTALTAGCNLPQARSLVLPGGAGPQAWIDAPLDGMHLPLSLPYDIVFHITSDSSVAQGELSINGQVLATLPNPVAGSNLAALHQGWTPLAPGEYTIRARAENSAGQWGDYAEAVVEVGQPTSTPTLTLTSTPTFTPSATQTAVVGVSFSNTSSPKKVYHGVCTPNQVLFAVAVTPLQNVQAVTIFTRLEDASGANHTAWDQGTAMNAKGNGIFQRSMPTSALPAVGQFNSALIQYQFVATDAGGTILARSPVYNDIQLGPCGFDFRLPNIHLFLVTPTNTPEIIK